MVDHRMVKHDSQEQLPSHFHRITEWPRHLWVRLIQPLLKQVPKAACPGPRPGGVWRSPRRRLHNLSGKPAPVLGHLHSKLVFKAPAAPLSRCQPICSPHLSECPYSRRRLGHRVPKPSPPGEKRWSRPQGLNLPRSGWSRAAPLQEVACRCLCPCAGQNREGWCPGLVPGTIHLLARGPSLTWAPAAGTRALPLPPWGILILRGPCMRGDHGPLVPAAPRCPLGRCRGSGWVLCPGAGGPVDAMCLFVLGGECCSPARGGTGTRMALRSLPSLNLHCLTAGALLTSIPWLWGLFGEEWASLRIRLLVGLPEKHSTETTEGEGGEEGTERGAWHESCCSAQSQELSADSRLGLPAWVPSLVGRKVPPNTSSWPRSAARLPPAHTEGLCMSCQHLTCLSGPSPFPSASGDR